MSRKKHYLIMGHFSGRGKPILFRCDGTSRIGLGHVSRSLALAEALMECGFTCRFLGNFDAGADEMLQSAEFPFHESAADTGSLEDLQGTLKTAQGFESLAIVVDTYMADDAYLACLDKWGAPVLFIDDFCKLVRYDCSAVLNCTVNAKALNYPRGKTTYFLGPSFFLARRPFRLMKKSIGQRTGAVKRVLIAIGGVDTRDLSRLAALSLLRISSALSVHVVVGRSYPYLTNLSSLVANFSDSSYVVTQLPDLAGELAWADVCICGGGLTKYESAFMGVPAAVLSQNIEQALETVHFAKEGLSVDMGMMNNNDPWFLARKLSQFFDDVWKRELMSKTGLAYFSTDPTRFAAESFAEYLFCRGEL